MRNKKLVLIEWVDSHSSTQGWQSVREITDLLDGPSPCKSVGWLVSEKGGVKVLVPHISNDIDGVAPYGRGEIAIPNKCITKLTVLRR